jgi:hypothetical protein
MKVETPSWGASLLVGLVGFGILGTAGVLALAAGCLAYLRDDRGLWEDLNPDLVACAGAAAGVAAWRFVAGPAGSPLCRGARAGLIAGLAAHPLCWLLYGAQGLARGQFAVGGPAGLAMFFLLLLWPTAATLGALGWISGPLGALIGVVVAVITSTRGPGEKSPCRGKNVDNPCDA